MRPPFRIALALAASLVGCSDSTDPAGDALTPGSYQVVADGSIVGKGSLTFELTLTYVTADSIAGTWTNTTIPALSGPAGAGYWNLTAYRITAGGSPQYIFRLESASVCQEMRVVTFLLNGGLDSEQWACTIVRLD